MSRLRLAALPFAFLLGSHAWAEQAVPPEAQTAIQHVIAAQIEAFRQEDGAAALAFASPGIRAQFGDGPHFLEMVRAAYPPVFHPRSFSFGAVSSDGGAVEQKVEFVGPSGETALGVYAMEHEADGSWRIAGCTLEKSERIDL